VLADTRERMLSIAREVKAMKRKMLLELVLVLGVAQIANGAWLRMQWRDLGPDDAEIQLAPHETAIIDIYFEMTRPEETLAALSFTNTAVDIITQTSTQALLPGWTDLSVDGALGSSGQYVNWTADLGAHVTGPGDYLIGSQTIRSDDDSIGRPRHITFAYDQMDVFDATGGRYTYSNPLSDSVPGFFGVGLGNPASPLTGTGSNPLIVITIPEAGSFGLLAIGTIAVLRRRIRVHGCSAEETSINT
jgi:hypothetical protein